VGISTLPAQSVSAAREGKGTGEREAHLIRFRSRSLACSLALASSAHFKEEQTL